MADRELWRAVLNRAYLDAMSQMRRDPIAEWLRTARADFEMCCDFAELDPHAVASRLWAALDAPPTMVGRD